MATLFVSYSRKDIDAARKLTQSFNDQGLDYWIDWEGIPPTVDWWKEIAKGIEEADIFLFLLSPDSAKSSVCRKEIEHAAQMGKRLIPVVVRDINAEESPAELRHLNWIFLREKDEFESGFGKLITAIKTDYPWVQTHRELQMKALEWERGNHDNSFLLRGKELQEAELQLVANSSKQPTPTDLQRDYILKSRQATDRQRRTITSITVGVIVALTALAIFAFVQAGLARTAQATAETNLSMAQTAQVIAENNEKERATQQALAEEQARIARAGELAAQAVLAREAQFDVSLLLSMEALRTADIPRTRSVLLDNIQTSPRLLLYLGSHPDAGWNVLFHPNGQSLAASNTDGEILIWDVATLQPVGLPLTGRVIAFSPDGKMLAASNREQGVALWDVETRQPIGQTLTGLTESVQGLAFSPDGKTLAASAFDSTVNLWDIQTGQLIAQLREGRRIATISNLAFSPDGQTLASGTPDNGIILWDLTTYRPIDRPLYGHADSIVSLAFSPDGKLLASGSADNTIILWETQSHLPIDEPLQGHTSWVTSVAFSPDGHTLASGSEDLTIMLWDVSTRLPLGPPLTGHTDAVQSVAFRPDGKTLVSGSDEIILWDMETQQPLGETLAGHASAVQNVVFSPNSKLLASSDANVVTLLWEALTLEPIGQPLLGHKITFSPDGNTLASLGVEGALFLWNVDSHSSIRESFEETTNSASSLAFRPDGRLLALGGNGKVYLWDTKTQQFIDPPLTGPANQIHTVAFSPDGKLLASGSEDGTILLWNLKTREPIDQPLTGHTTGITNVAFSRSGKILVSSGAEIILWDVASQKSIGLPFPGHVAALSPDGATLAAGSADGTIILWDVVSHQPIGPPFTGNTGWVNSLDFSPDGKTLAAGDTDGTIIVWDVDSQSWIEKSCQRAGRNFTRAEWEQYFPTEEYRKTCQQWPLEPEVILTPSPAP
jgi:WD40 repeat protein